MLIEPAPRSSGKLFRCFMVSLTFLWLLLTTLGTLTGEKFIFMAKAAPSILILFILLIIIMVRKNVAQAEKISHFQLLDPVMIYGIYLFWSLISLTLSITPRYNYWLGFGYLAFYVITLLIAGLLYSIFQNIQSIKQNENPLCYAAFLASSVLLIATLFALASKGFKTPDQSQYMEAFFGASGVGLLSICVTIYPLAYGWTISRGFLFMLAAFLVFMGGSRTSLVSIFCACLAVLFVKSKKLSLILLLIIFAALIASPKLIKYMQEDVFLMHDDYRGFQNLSGRIGIWQYSLKKIKEHPFMGSGFRMSDFELRKDIGISSAHNAYLTSLLETGIVGTALMLLAVLTAYWRMLKGALRSQDKTCLFYFGVISASLLFAMGERFLINVGNPTSILLIFSLFYSRLLPFSQKTRLTDTSKEPELLLTKAHI